MIEDVEHSNDAPVYDSSRSARGRTQVIVKWILGVDESQCDHSVQAFVICAPETLAVTAEHLVLEAEATDVAWRGFLRGVMVVCVCATRVFTPGFWPHAATLSQWTGFFRSGRVARTGDGSSVSVDRRTN